MSGEAPASPTLSRIPNVEPGDYRACWMLPSEKAGFDLGVVPQGRCANGFLSPNGELTLRLPDSRVWLSNRAEIGQPPLTFDPSFTARTPSPGCSAPCKDT